MKYIVNSIQPSFLFKQKRIVSFADLARLENIIFGNIKYYYNLYIKHCFISPRLKILR